MGNNAFVELKWPPIFFAFGKPNFRYFLTKIQRSNVGEVINAFTIRYKAYLYGLSCISITKIDLSNCFCDLESI